MSLPLFIFLAEMCVVTLGTLRIIFVSRGLKYLAPCLGFFEINIWLIAITQIMRNLNDWTCFLAFSMGFTVGNFLGILFEKKLAMGLLNIRIISSRDTDALIEKLREEQFGVTRVQGEGAAGPVEIVMTVIKRRQLNRVTQIIETFDARAFYAVDEIQGASAGIFPFAKVSRFAATRERSAGMPVS